MIKSVLILVLTIVSYSLTAENPSLNYIAQYKQIAIEEMHRTGIPASIKLAQALLESGSGRSSLAREANNHFGIKCGGKWNGGTYYREDDDYNKKGELIKSCFRKFKNAGQSFIAHSHFLTDQKRYAFLFDFHHTDYHSWAKGLRKAGYATDKKYPQKLIHLIEKYQLYLLDSESSSIVASHSNKEEIETKETYSEETVVLAESSQAAGTVTTTTSYKSNRRSRVNKEAKTHTVQGNQTIAEIAMLYGLEENGVRMRNRLPKDAEPLPGEKIYLRKKISLLKRPKFVRLADGMLASADEEFIF